MVLTQTEGVQVELERILNSTEFISSPRLVRFFRYCVEQTCEGRLENLKESVIGVSVFDRNPDYDPKVDPIVRVHARRLREKLDTFYSSERSPHILIQIPKGGYVARFEEVGPRGITKERPGADILPDVVPVISGKPLVAKLKSRIWLISIAVALLALAFAAFAEKANRRDLGEPAVQPLVNLPGAAQDPAWAPNGASVAFTWDGGGREQSHVYLLKKGETVPNKLTENNLPEYRPVWSPDGTQIALLREWQDNHFSLVIVDLTRKTERVVRFEIEAPHSQLPATRSSSRVRPTFTP